MNFPKYKITYIDRSVTQEKWLIPYEIYINNVKKWQYIAFTENSPLFDAISTGVLELLDIQGGNHNVKITKI